MEQLTIIKVGGKIVEEAGELAKLTQSFALISGHKILVHGGGRSATALAARMGVETQMIEGRRVTDAQMLDIVTMVYGGLVNKNIVARLQELGVNALGLTGADLNLIRSHKRTGGKVDYGFVGDVEEVNAAALRMLLENGTTPVLAPLTHDCKGNILNTNADTIAAETAKALSRYFNVTLIYCFEKHGVLRDENDDGSVIPLLNAYTINQLTEESVISGGMIPKLHNAVQAVQAGVCEVVITHANNIDKPDRGTHITK